MNVVREIEKLNQTELELGVSDAGSWHAKYRQSAYIFVGNLDFELSEGDIICVFSQFGEVVDCNLIREEKSGESKGFCFIAYEDQRSTVLAVDNMNGATLLGRTLRVDHVLNYRKTRRRKRKDGDGSESGTDSDEYDERRKRIWDYELYQTADPIPTTAATAQSTTAASSANSSTADEHANANRQTRILELLQKRKAERAAATAADPYAQPVTTFNPFAYYTDGTQDPHQVMLQAHRIRELEHEERIKAGEQQQLKGEKKESDKHQHKHSKHKDSKHSKHKDSKHSKGDKEKDKHSHKRHKHRH